MKKTCIIAAALMAVTLTAAAFAEPQITNGTISDVIVYHGRALVTRTIELDAKTGDLELLVENLPERILPESLYAQAQNGIQVLSVRYRVKEIKEDPRQEIRELDQQIEDVDKQIYRSLRDKEQCNVMYGKFAHMWDLSFDTAKTSFEKGAFSAESMKDYTTYLEQKNNAWHDKAVGLEQQKKDLEKQMEELRNKREQLSRGHNRIIRQALVYLHKDQSAASTIQLSYLVDQADWSPQYNLKADPDNNQVNIEYNAVVHQASGEDWNNAKLALSTAVPALVATPPQLDPLKITLTSAQARNARMRGLDMEMPQDQSIQVSLAQGVPMEQQQVYSFQNQSEQFGKLAQSRRDNIAKGIMANDELNFFAANTQMIEFEADKRMLAELKQQAVAIRRAEGVSVMYTLPGKLTLPSKSDQQLVTIAAFASKADFTFIAAPLLTDYVYLQADIINAGDTILLPGPASMFRKGEFVGKGDMSLVTIGQTFTAGFGVDSQIQVAREFKDKKIETLWGNRVDEQHYRIEINNYYDKSVALRLMDRLPWTENAALSIEMGTVSHPLSTDAEYVRTQKEKGILRWDLTLNANSTGKDAAIVNYSFTMKYDNDLAIQPTR